MLSLSRKSILAVEAVVDIAHHGRHGPVSSKHFAARMGIPRRQLEPVLQALVRDGILKSVRGPRGGYVLARERRRISLGDIVRSGGAERDLDCPHDTALSEKVVTPVIADALAAAVEALNGTSLSDVMAQANEAGLLDKAEVPDFSI
jgi:Rrf2 family iron-sulfur cluster assembly transcriptional regulator